jgi:hypothetical protein
MTLIVPRLQGGIPAPESDNTGDEPTTLEER